MTLWRYYVAILATLAVVGIGWVGWEQHCQTEQQIKQTCLARVAVLNATLSDLLSTVVPARSDQSKTEARILTQEESARKSCG